MSESSWLEFRFGKRKRPSAVFNEETGQILFNAELMGTYGALIAMSDGRPITYFRKSRGQQDQSLYVTEETLRSFKDEPEWQADVTNLIEKCLEAVGPERAPGEEAK